MRTTPSLMYSVKRLEQVIRSHLDEMLSDTEVTTLQYTALTALAHRDGISGARLARESFVTPQSMAEMLKLLQARGYIDRKTNPQSRREYLVYITEEGREFIRATQARADAIEARMLHGLTKSEITLMQRTMTLAWANLLDSEVGRPGSAALSIG